MVVGKPIRRPYPPFDIAAVDQALRDIRINHEPLEIAVQRMRAITAKPYGDSDLMEKVKLVACLYGPNRVGDLGLICRTYEMLCRNG